MVLGAEAWTGRPQYCTHMGVLAYIPCECRQAITELRYSYLWIILRGAFGHSRFRCIAELFCCVCWGVGGSRLAGGCACGGRARARPQRACAPGPGGVPPSRQGWGSFLSTRPCELTGLWERRYRQAEADERGPSQGGAFVLLIWVESS